MTDEERERELRDAVERLGYPWSAEEADRITACRKRCEHPDCKLARAVLAALDENWFKQISDEGTIVRRDPREYRESIVRAMHAAVFGEEPDG